MNNVIKKLFSRPLSPPKLLKCIKNCKHVSCIATSSPAKSRYLSSVGRQKSVYLVDDSDSNGDLQGNISKYTGRTHTCGELRSEHIGRRVVLYGWLEYQRMNKFLVLRDSYGEIQLIIPEEDKSNQKLLESIPLETIIEIKGTVLSRPKDMFNTKQPTGEIEVSVESFKIVNKAKDNLPFNIREFQKAKEALRMHYRYLDIRFPQMQTNLRVRSKLLMKMREFLINNHFVDVETPTLFKATPGGAQEFVVPTRIPNKFYSLVQSPQQFKQMLMAGAIDRYFQIARCYRDEGARPDRQPEFTQLDIELSFTNVEAILNLVEDLLSYSLAEFVAGVPKKFDRLPYEVALEEYGCDKPDVRFEFKLKNCTELLSQNKNLTLGVKDFAAYVLEFPKELANLNKNLKEHMVKVANQYPGTKLVQTKVTSHKEWVTKLSRLLTDDVAHKILEKYEIGEESVLFLTYGEKNEARSLLGKVRLEYVNFLENLGMTIRKKGLHFLWLVDFPLFELSKETGALQSAHHPFTAPHPGDLELLEADPLKVRAQAYDLVLNGHEAAGGSIRIHDPMLQEYVLKLLNIEQHTLQHMIDMLGSGCPPHGGIAFGLDRLLSVLLNTNSIRDVIAFPKTFEGKEPISQAPSEIPEETLKLYHIQTTGVSDK